MGNKNVRARARLCRKGDMWHAACPTRAHAPALRNPQLSSYREQKCGVVGLTFSVSPALQLQRGWFSYSMYSVIILVNKTIVHTPNVQPNTPYLLVSDSFRYLTQRGVEDARYE